MGLCSLAGPLCKEEASEQFPPSEASLPRPPHERIVNQKAAVALRPKKGRPTYGEAPAWGSGGF
jgi:hypothetical protein